jgi:hypothetical protein
MSEGRLEELSIMSLGAGGGCVGPRQFMCTPASARDSLACGIMRIVIRARTLGSYAFNYSLGGFCEPTRRGLRCEPE